MKRESNKMRPEINGSGLIQKEESVIRQQNYLRSGDFLRYLRFLFLNEVGGVQDENKAGEHELAAWR